MYKLHSGYEMYSVFCNDLDLCLTFDPDTRFWVMHVRWSWLLFMASYIKIPSYMYKFYVWLAYENDINFHCDLDLRPWQPTVGLCISSGHAHHSYQFIPKSLHLCRSYIPDTKVTMFFCHDLDLRRRHQGYGLCISASHSDHFCKIILKFIHWNWSYSAKKKCSLWPWPLT